MSGKQAVALDRFKLYLSWYGGNVDRAKAAARKYGGFEGVDEMWMEAKRQWNKENETKRQKERRMEAKKVKVKGLVYG